MQALAEDSEGGNFEGPRLRLKILSMEAVMRVKVIMVPFTLVV